MNAEVPPYPTAALTSRFPVQSLMELKLADTMVAPSLCVEMQDWKHEARQGESLGFRR